MRPGHSRVAVPMPYALHPVTRWLLEECPDDDPIALFAGLCERLIHAGVPLWRSTTSLMTLHPQVYVRDLRWTRGEGCQSILRPHEILTGPDYVGSPAQRIQQGEAAVRCRLVGAGDALQHSVLRDLASAGGTDYLILPLRFGGHRISFVSFTTDAPNGFADADLELLQHVLPFLTLRLALASASFATRSLLEVYLGHNAAERVLAGAFRRGTGETLRTAILFCDLRGFTAFTDERPVRVVVQTLDRYFEAVAGPIAAHGGEVLKFIGDALLAVFTSGQAHQDEADACRRALAAAREAVDAIERLSSERRVAEAEVGGAGLRLRIGVALNYGEVMYGNIGAADRLDFTVIGRAVNEASRVESLCKELRAPVLMTGAFASRIDPSLVRSLGLHALRGVSEPQEIFALSDA